MLVRTSGIIIPKNYKNINSILESLDKRIYNFMDNSYKNVKFYYEYDNDNWIIPRYYPLNDDIKDDIPDGDYIEISHKIIPRSEDQKECIEFVSTNRSGILKRQMGTGKTVIAIAAICNKKQKALIIVPSVELIDTWISEFLLHTDIKQDKIGKLDSKHYKKVLDESYIVFSTPQLISMSIKNKNDEFLEYLKKTKFGTMICDETHKSLGPEKFSQFSSLITCKSTWGLSATPKRKDGCDDIMKYHLGNIFEFGHSDEEVISPEIYVKFFHSNISEKSKKYIYWQGKLIYQRYYQMLKNNDRYTDLLVKDILSAYNNNRNILVIASRIDILLTVVKKLNLPKSEIGIFLPTLKNKKEILKYSDITDLTEAYQTKRIVFATYSGAREGLSRKSLDCMFMITPTPDAEQVIGRVTRALENKKTPIVVDYVDTVNLYRTRSKRIGEVPVFLNQLKKRIELYTTKKWNYKKIDMRK